jgi:hypothetical protein
MPTDQDDADALFGGAAAPPAASSPFGAKPTGDGRKEARVRANWQARVRANWQARVLLPNDRIVELNVFDISESGIGLVSEQGIPANSVLQLALAVPGLNEPTRITPITGSIKTTHMTVRGQLIHCGGTWVTLPSESRDLINQWLRRLRK